jgi:hypothetical protein
MFETQLKPTTPASQKRMIIDLKIRMEEQEDALMEMTRLTQKIDGQDAPDVGTFSPKFDMNPEPVNLDFTKNFQIMEDKNFHP